VTAIVEAKEAGAGVEALTQRVVEERTPLVVAREGEALVVVLPVAEYERLGGRLGEPEVVPGREDWWELARQSREAIHRRRNGRPMPPSEDVIHEMREERDAQILANVRRR
jgi:PHD/YefM family antitoxin component YafN of YafNO toxin-antitoxin module